MNEFQLIWIWFAILGSNELIQIFKSTYFKVFKYFKKYYKTSLVNNLSNLQLSSQILSIQDKLQKYVRQKQLLITRINQKKSLKHLKQQMDKKIRISQMPMLEILQLRQIIFKAKTIQRKLDVGRVSCMKQKMIEGWNKLIINQDEKHGEHVQKLQNELQHKSEELRKISQHNYSSKTRVAQEIQKLSMLTRQSNDTLTKIQTTKLQLHINKQKNKQTLHDSYDKIHITAQDQQHLISQLTEYQTKQAKRSKQNQKELSILRQELEQVYNIQNEQVRLMEPKGVKVTSFMGDGVRVVKSKYQLGSQGQLVGSEDNLPEGLPEFSMDNRRQQQIVTGRLVRSRIAMTTESIRLLRGQIDQKVRTQQQLQQKLSAGYVNLSRVNTQYKNNSARLIQTRKIQIKKTQKKGLKLENMQQNNQENIKKEQSFLLK